MDSTKPQGEFSVDELLNVLEEGNFPRQLKVFFNALINGPTFNNTAEKLSLKASSLVSDLIFNVTRGQTVPSKQVALGLSLKYMTGSKQVLQILNKLGHSINYWKAEEIETMIPEEITENFFTGTDQTTAFKSKGKVKPLKILFKSTAYQEVFSQPGKDKAISLAVSSALEKFTCEMYGRKKIENINKPRVDVFFSVTKPKSGNPFANVKKIDPAALPPCKTVLQNKIARANYLASIWNNGALANPQDEMDPIENGWDLEEIDKCKYIVRWNNALENLRETLLAEESKSDDEVEAVSSSQCSSTFDGWDNKISITIHL